MSKLRKVYSLMRAEKYSHALRELEKLENQVLLYPKVLVLKGICVFLSNNEYKYSYDDIERLYKKAMTIDDEYVESLLELGHHYYASENKAEKSLPLFEKALRILKDQTMDAILGYAKCIEEVKSPKEAIKYLKKIKTEFIEVKKIAELIDEFTEI